MLRTPGRNVQSVADSSFDAWIKFYRPDENAPNAVVSYYVKGSLVALALDLTMRLSGSSLDAVMRALWQRYGASGSGVPEDGILALATELGGRDLDDFFARYVHGTDDPPLEALLRAFGVALNLRVARSGDDRGGKPAKEPMASDARPLCWLGVKLAPGAEAKLQHVYTGGPAEQAGLAGGDTVVAIDGLRASPESIRNLLRRRKAGETLTVHAFRRDELFTATLTLAEAPRDTCWLTLSATIGDEVRARRDAWLGIVPVSEAAQ
jgi:predicted metalloprotease with PDZ domain